MTIKYIKGFKYQLTEPVSYWCKEDLGIKDPYNDNFISCTPNGLVTLNEGFAWDGASCFPDFDWMMEGSAFHDSFCRLIEFGIIPEDKNDLIDKELYNVIIERAPYPIGGERVLDAYAKIVERGTNLANSRRKPREIIIVGRLPK